MEPVNKTQTHQLEDVSKTNANGENFLGCPGCDSRACTQANCWRVFCPPFPRCVGCIKSGEDLAFPQPCFFDPQFLYPFFHNNSVSQHYNCSHGGCNTNLKSEFITKDQVNYECGNSQRMATPQIPSQKMKKKTVRDKISEKNNVPENESKHLPQCQNHRPCDCRESLIWPSNSFIVPIVSYCVLWHPQNPNDNCSNYIYSQMENLNEKGGNVEGDEFSNSESNYKYGGNMDVESECVQGCSEDGMTKKETDRKHIKSSSSFLSLHSSTNNKNEIYSIKKKNSSSSSPSSPSVNAESDANSEEEVGEELQARSSDLSRNSQNHLSVESNKNALSNAVDYSDIYFGGNESQRSSMAGSEYDMKAEDSSAEAEDVDDQVECLNEPLEERNIHISPKSSLESLEEKNLREYSDTNTESCGNLKTKPKMLIKNFTVTNRTESAFEGTPKNLAAAGDLGGNNCVGYKVNIEPEEAELENLSSDTAKQTLEIKRIPIKVLEEKNPKSFLDKGIDLKAPRNSRTGIARLIQDSKSRDGNIDGMRSIKSENNEPECNDTKSRRFQMREEISKLQKDKPSGMAVQKNDLKRQNPTSNLKNKLPSKEKKFSAPKVRPRYCERNSRKKFFLGRKK